MAIIVKPITAADLAAMESRKIIREVVEGQDENMTGKRHVLPLPDVSFAAAGREDEQNPDEAHYLAPDLAIEIISPSERYNEIRAKHYFRAGVRQVLPELQEVVVNFPDGTARTHHADQKTPGGEILPEVELSAADIFAE